MTDRTVDAVFHPDDESVVDEFQRLLADATAADGDGEVWTVTRHTATTETEVARLTADAAGDADAVAAVGGDGSVSLMLAGMADSGVPLVIVPAGTVNLTAQLVGTGTVERAAAALAASETVTVDLGADTAAGDALFVINASSGYDATVIDEGEDHSDVRFGRLVFARAAIRRLRRDAPKAVRVVVDGETVFDGRAMSVIVMNAGQRASASLDVAPDAEMDDGRLDVAVSRVSTIPGAARVIWRLARGSEVSAVDVIRAQGEAIDVEWSTDVDVQRDGDPTGRSRSLRYRVRPSALCLVTHGDPS